MDLVAIHINWEGPYGLKEIDNLNNEATDYGIYQVYGGHPVYGSNVLLYIGKSDQQTFGKRIKQENWIYNRDYERVKIYLGRLGGYAKTTETKWSGLIDCSEKLLIYSHSPACNSSNINSIPEKKLQKFHIFNWGTHRDLMAEISGVRWTSYYDDISGYHIYGEQ